MYNKNNISNISFFLLLKCTFGLPSLGILNNWSPYYKISDYGPLVLMAFGFLWFLSTFAYVAVMTRIKNYF